MGITRAQYLSPPPVASDGSPVLTGQVQGVKVDLMSGIRILPDGTLRVAPEQVNGWVRTNNETAYNDYIWPTIGPGNNTAVVADATGALAWWTIGQNNGIGNPVIGTVYNVDASGGTTGLLFTGGPVRTEGVLTLGGILAVAHGGTGANNPSDARDNLGAGTVRSVDGSGGTTGLTLTGGPIIVNGTLTLGGILAVAHGGTGANNPSDARDNLGAGTVRSITFTDGLYGGTITNSGTVGISNTGVSPGSYTNPQLTVNSRGQITAISGGATVSYFEPQFYGADGSSCGVGGCDSGGGSCNVSSYSVPVPGGARKLVNLWRGRVDIDDAGCGQGPTWQYGVTGWGIYCRPSGAIQQSGTTWGFVAQGHSARRAAEGPNFAQTMYSSRVDDGNCQGGGNATITFEGVWASRQAANVNCSAVAACILFYT